VNVCTIGDLLLDVIVRIDDPITLDTDTFSKIEIAAGGQAANVAAWVQELGHQGRVLCTRSDDPPGALLTAELARRGIEVRGPRSQGRTGTVVSLSQTDGMRTMLTDRGDAPAFAATALDATWLEGIAWLHVSGYALADGLLRDTTVRAAAMAREAGAQISIDLASTRIIEQVGAPTVRGLLEQLHPPVIFATEVEKDSIAPPCAQWPSPETTWVTKRGAAGCVVTRDGRSRSYPALPARIIDPHRRGRRIRSRLSHRRRRHGPRDGRPVSRTNRSDALISTAAFTIASEVSTAIAADTPTVALETTLLSHGFPRGRGATVAIESEQAVRNGGAVPATVGVLDGRIRVGLNHDELQVFAQQPDTRKIGARDLASCLVAGVAGATTVGGTLAACRAIGLRVFATGGIGGVHRGYAERPDISSDLGELARSQTIVVCSGVKSLLDVDATTEALETLGVPLFGWQTDRLPLFYSSEGGPEIERVDSLSNLARIARTHWELAGQGILLTRAPDPDIPAPEIEGLFGAALAAARRDGVVGSAVTPFVLAHVHDASDGRTLDVNHRLIVDNAALAADVAVALQTTRI